MTLTEAAHWTKRLVWFALAGFVLFIVLVIVILNKSKPQQIPRYMYPDFACTNTAEEFVRYRLDIPSIDYTLEPSADAFTLATETGRIEQIPEIVNVYRYDNPEQILTAQNDAKKLAEALGFDPTKMQNIGTTVYRWADQYSRTLTVQARNFVFDLKFDFTKPNSKPEGELPTNEQAKQAARDFLSNTSLLTRDYSEIMETLDITILPNGTFRQAKYRQEANLIRVDFMREASMITLSSRDTGYEEARDMLIRKGHKVKTEDVQTPEGKTTLYKFNTAITTLDPIKSNISMYIGARHPDLKGRGVNQIYGIEYTNWILEPNYCGTYKLINPALALTYVQNGEASLVFLNEKDGDLVLQDGTKNVRNFHINNISLAYYDAPHELDFLQPVYLISGEATFTAGTKGTFIFYYPAIDYDSIQDSLTTQEELL
jgi:hypothetical protein